MPQRPGSVLRHLRHHDTQLFNIKAGVSVGPNVAGAIWFDAHSVKMWDAAKPNNIVPYTLPGGGWRQPDGHGRADRLLVRDPRQQRRLVARHTHQTASPGSRRAPGKCDSRPTLQTALQSNPYWDVVYGGKNYDPQNRRVSIIGSRATGTWKIYAQKLENMMPHGVRKVKRIF